MGDLELDEAHEILDAFQQEARGVSRTRGSVYDLFDRYGDNYHRLSREGQAVFKQAVRDRIISRNRADRDDAISFARHLRIVEAIPELKRLRRRLSYRPWAIDDREEVDRLLHDLEQERHMRPGGR